MSEMWNPKENKCSLVENNDNIFVEEIDEAETDSDLVYGKIVSCPDDEEWLYSICEYNRTILFKRNKNIFGFISKDDVYHYCYVIKSEDILGQFFNEEKE